MTGADLLVLNIGELVTLAGGPGPRRGAEMGDLRIKRDMGVAIRRGKIIAVGDTRRIRNGHRCRRVLNAEGRCVTPGLVDAHTHLVFASARPETFERIIGGTAYADLGREGEGVAAVVKATRRASKSELAAMARIWMQRMLTYGTTTAEVKSGYGLTLKDEIRILEVVRDLSRRGTVTLVPTFFGAHETPPEMENRRSDYVRLVIDRMIPEVAKQGLAKFCDVLCEVGIFSADESRRILEAAKRAGLVPKIHAEEFRACGGAELAADLKAASADHLTAVTDRGIRLLKQSGTIAVVLPATPFFLGTGRYAPARRMIDEGLAVALGSNFNPVTAMTLNLPFILSLACTQMKLRPEEALCAATINSAHAIGMGDQVGSVEEGKRADLVVWDTPDYRHIPYVCGVNLVWKVVKGGKILIQAPDAKRGP